MRATLGNLMAGIPAVLPEEFVTVLAEADHVRIERIVSRGHASPPRFLVRPRRGRGGAARAELQGRGEVPLSLGDWIDIPRHLRHRQTRTRSGWPCSVSKRVTDLALLQQLQLLASGEPLQRRLAPERRPLVLGGLLVYEPPGAGTTVPGVALACPGARDFGQMGAPDVTDAGRSCRVSARDDAEAVE